MANRKEKLAVLNNVLWVPNEHVSSEQTEDYTYRHEVVTFEPNLHLPSDCSNCDLWGKEWRSGRRTCEDLGYTLNDVCSSFTHKKFPVRQEQVIKTWKRFDDDWTIFARGDLAKIKRNFGYLGIEDQRSSPKLPFDLVCKTTPYPHQQVVLDEWLKKKCGILQAPTGWGKSTHLPTCVCTSHGLLTMAEIIELATGKKPEELPEGVAFGVPGSLGLRATAKGGFDEPITHVTVHKSPTLLVKTQWGQEIGVTPEHPLMVCNPAKGPEWKQAKDLEPGDRVAIRSMVPGRGPNVPVLKEEAYFIMGILTADGTCTNRNQITLTKFRPKILGPSEDFFRRLGCEPTRRRRKGKKVDTDLIIRDTEFYDKIVSWGLSPTTAAYKRVPWTVMQGDAEAISMFLRGYFTGDGDVEVKKGVVQVISASQKLLQDVQMLLLCLGIPSSILPKKTTYKGEVREGYWRITIDREWVGAFADLVGFLPGCHKEEQLNEVLEARGSLKANTNKYTIPSHVLMRNLYLRAKESEAGGFGGKALREVGVEHYIGPTNKKLPPPQKLAAFLDLYKSYEEYAEFESLNVLLDMSEEKGVFWVPVESIEDGGETLVADITVPGQRYYVGNGFVSHNTVAWSWLIAHLHRRTLLLAQETRHINVGYEGLYEHTNIADLELAAGKKLIGRVNKKYKDIGRDPETGYILWKETASPGAHYPITFATYQSFTSKRGKKLRKKLKNYFGVVWNEEAHHSSAMTFHAVIKSFNPRYRGGQTATPTRKDNTHVAIYDTVGPVNAKGTKEAMNPIVHFHNTNVFVPDSCFKSMYPNVQIINYLARNKSYNDFIMEKILEEIEEGRRVLLITERVKFGTNMMQKIKIHGYGVEMIKGGAAAQKMKEQNWYAEELMKGDLNLIIGTKVINENVNIPPLDSIHLPFPSFTKETEEQRVGRVRRELTGSNRKFLKNNGIDWDKPQPRVHVYTWACNTDSKGRNYAANAAGFRAKLFKKWGFDMDDSSNHIESTHKKRTMRDLFGDEDE